MSVERTSVVLAAFSTLIALVATLQACSSTRSQAAFQRDIEERQSAPLLVPGVTLAERGQRIAFYPEAGSSIMKRAERLMIARRPPRLIVPMRNAGEGVAILLGERFPLLRGCGRDAITAVGKPKSANPLGYYTVGPDTSEQLGSLPARGSTDFAAYEKAFSARKLFVLVRYTDVHLNKLRWTCIAYTRPNDRGGWSLSYPVYGEAPWPGFDESGPG